jgi:hypothetical protein
MITFADFGWSSLDLELRYVVEDGHMGQRAQF